VAGAQVGWIGCGRFDSAAFPLEITPSSALADTVTGDTPQAPDVAKITPNTHYPTLHTIQSPCLYPLPKSQNYSRPLRLVQFNLPFQNSVCAEPLPRSKTAETSVLCLESAISTASLAQLQNCQPLAM